MLPPSWNWLWLELTPPSMLAFTGLESGVLSLVLIVNFASFVFSRFSAGWLLLLGISIFVAGVSAYFFAIKLRTWGNQEIDTHCKDFGFSKQDLLKAHAARGHWLKSPPQTQ